MPLTPAMRQKIDQIRDYLWGGGYPDPLSNAEQLSYLFFFYLLEHIDEDNKLRAKGTGRAYESLFAGEWTLQNPLNAPAKGVETIPKDRLRWSSWARGLSGENLVRFVRDEVFPFYHEVAAHAAQNFMANARLGIDEPMVLTQVVQLIDNLRLDEADADSKGDLFEYVLKQIRQAGELGQFRTPRHIIRTIVAMVDPRIGETIYDPAAGTAGFLVAAYDHIRLANSSDFAIQEVEVDGKNIRRGYGDRLSETMQDMLATTTFFGNDVDAKMVSLATMNLILRGLPDVHILRRNVLTTNLDRGQRAELGLPLDGFSVVLANPPFSGKIDKDRIVDDVKIGTTTATEVLFLKYMMNSLRPGGRCGVIVPEGVLRGSSSSHLELRRHLLTNFRVTGVIGLPHFVFKPYASVSTFILLFERAAPSDQIWMYQVDEDGFSQNSLRSPMDDDDLPDLLEEWANRLSAGYRPQKGKHAFVPIDCILRDRLILVPKHYLRNYSGNGRYPEAYLGQLCYVQKGRLAAKDAQDEGEYPFITTAETIKRANCWQFEGPAICIPLVSSTGHGHASINRISLIEGRFAAATIVAVLKAKNEMKFGRAMFTRSCRRLKMRP